MSTFISIMQKGADIVAELGIGMNPMVQKNGIDATLEEEYKKKLLPGLIKHVKAWKKGTGKTACPAN